MSTWPFQRTGSQFGTLNSLDMFGPRQLVSTLLPAVFHSPAAHFFPTFPTRLASQPQILIPGPFISYESLRNYLQPDPCKEALLLATQAVGMGPLAEGTGKVNPRLPWPNGAFSFTERGDSAEPARRSVTTLPETVCLAPFVCSVNVYKRLANSS